MSQFLYFSLEKQQICFIFFITFQILLYSTACVRALNDRMYERRKAAALEIEKMVNKSQDGLGWGSDLIGLVWSKLIRDLAWFDFISLDFIWFDLI